jgi:hypothetical protein
MHSNVIYVREDLLLPKNILAINAKLATKEKNYCVQYKIIRKSYNYQNKRCYVFTLFKRTWQHKHIKQ